MTERLSNPYRKKKTDNNQKVLTTSHAQKWIKIPNH
jgi:hypothetical protein